jgi:antitoxin component of RelBE/YafQ-DinJ toxin-antitoxin module
MEMIMGQIQSDLSGLKANAEAFFSSYGLTLSTGINALLKLAREQGENLLDISFQNDEEELRASTPEELRADSAAWRAGRLETVSFEEMKAIANVLRH